MRLLRIVPDDTKFDFMRFRRISFPLSALLSILAISLYFFHGLNFGIDFRGGTLLEVRQTEGVADLAKMRATIATLGLGEAQLQQFGGPSEVLIRIAEQPGGEIGAAIDMRDRIFGARARGIVHRLEVAAIMQQHRQEAQLAQVLCGPGFSAGGVACVQQPRHAERGLQGVLEIVIVGVNGPVAGVLAGEAPRHPAKYAGYKPRVASRKHASIDMLHRCFHHRGIIRGNGRIHLLIS